MKQGLKRPLKAYLAQVCLIFIVLYVSTKNSSELGQWMLRVLAIGGLVSLVHIIIKRSYFEVIDNKLVINEGIFIRRKIELNKIEKFDINPNPFSLSKIILKDQTKIRYSDFQTNDKKLREFMGQFNIPVE